MKPLPPEDSEDTPDPDPVQFLMLMRNQRRDLRIFRDVVRDDHVPDESTTALSPHRITGDSWEARFALGLCLPDVWTAWDADADRLWVATTDARSWAAVDRDRDRFAVHQYGPRRLWDEVEAAYLWWEDQGCPGPAGVSGRRGPGGSVRWPPLPGTRRAMPW